MTKLFLPFLLATATGFVLPPSAQHHRQPVSLKSSLKEETDLAGNLDEIAHKLRLQVFDVNTNVYGMESKDPFFGIENIHTRIHFDPSLGLELTEVAHSDFGHRGLVLVSKVEGNAVEETPIKVGDCIIGVFAGQEFKESTTGLDYDDTVDVIARAKQHALDQGLGSISLELNRLVKRAAVQLEVEGEDGKITKLDALAGDNLRLFLMHHHLTLYDPNTHRIDQPNLTGDCGGEGICGTCLVDVRQGMEHLNKIGPQEQSILMKRPPTWRAACKTVLGADNKQDTTLRIRLHPQTFPVENKSLSP